MTGKLLFFTPDTLANGIPQLAVSQQASKSTSFRKVF